MSFLFLRNLFYLIASNRGILKGCLQVLHVHVLLVAPLGTCHMTQPGTDSTILGFGLRRRIS